VTSAIASARAIGSVPTVAPESPSCLLWFFTSGRYRIGVDGASKAWWAPGYTLMSIGAPAARAHSTRAMHGGAGVQSSRAPTRT